MWNLDPHMRGSHVHRKGVYSNLLGINASLLSTINAKIEVKSTLAYTVVGETFTFGPATIPAAPTDFEFAKTFAVLSNALLAQGKVKVHTVSVNETGDGLEGVLKGMQFMREGKVSGKKLVYTW
ncbi:hypothetical protein HDU98_002933 [Podochytrium sp. JEL0797]|nr:hypothetical protein HDU98_002933 [Podochytrium sp. JEL0797]